MKMVYTAPNVIPCDFLKSLLDAEDIWSTVRNPQGSWTVGEGLPLGTSLVWAWPEVWVNDEDFDIASEMAADFRENHSEGKTKQ
ncbi:MAG: DUF2007 domain-containing protein [Verrucomicrobiia bacterium]